MAIGNVPESMTKITGQATELGGKGIGSQFSVSLSRLCTSCKPSHRELFLPPVFPRCLCNTEIVCPSGAEGRFVC